MNAAAAAICFLLHRRRPPLRAAVLRRRQLAQQALPEGGPMLLPWSWHATLACQTCSGCKPVAASPLPPSCLQVCHTGGLRQLLPSFLPSFLFGSPSGASCRSVRRCFRPPRAVLPHPLPYAGPCYCPRPAAFSCVHSPCCPGPHTVQRSWRYAWTTSATSSTPVPSPACCRCDSRRAAVHEQDTCCFMDPDCSPVCVLATMLSSSRPCPACPMCAGV